MVRDGRPRARGNRFLAVFLHPVFVVRVGNRGEDVRVVVFVKGLVRAELEEDVAGVDWENFQVSTKSERSGGSNRSKEKEWNTH